MGAPADQHALREALARAEAERDALRAIVLADDAKAIAEYEWERANKLVAERDAAVADQRAMLIQVGEHARARGEAEGRLQASEIAGIVEGWRTRALAAEAENTRLKETVEAARAALGLAIQFVDVAAGEGLSFDADGDRPMMDAADVCFAVAETLGIDDLDSDAYRALVARSVLATIPPKENP